MRTLTFFIFLGLLGACRGSVEVSGLYANAPATYPEVPPPLVQGTGQFFPCTRPGAIWWIHDPGLAKRYRLVATHLASSCSHGSEAFWPTPEVSTGVLTTFSCARCSSSERGSQGSVRRWRARCRRLWGADGGPPNKRLKLPGAHK